MEQQTLTVRVAPLLRRSAGHAAVRVAGGRLQGGGQRAVRVHQLEQQDQLVMPRGVE